MNKLFSKIAAASVGLAMAVGVGVAAGHEAKAVRAADETVSWTVDKGDNLGAKISSQGGTASGTIQTGDFSWSYTRTLVALTSGKSDYVALQGETWIQLGSSNSLESIVFSTSAIEGEIQSVSVTAATAGTHKLTIDVGGTKYLDAADLQTYTGTAAATNPNPSSCVKTGTGTSSGAITITIESSNTTTKKAMLIRSISVTYSAGSSDTFKVTYNGNGSDSRPVENVPAAVTDLADGTVQSLSGSPTRWGYTFKGWGLTADATETVSSVTIDGANVIVYALWNEDHTVHGAWSDAPYSVAEVRAAIDVDTSKTLPSVYVTGIISQVTEFKSSYKSITYWISDDGTKTNEFEAYSGKGLNGADFAAITDIEVGATVVLCGNAKFYSSGSIYEYDFNNYMISYEAPSTGDINVTFEPATTIAVGDSGTYSASTTATNPSYVFSSSNESVLEVAENGAFSAVAAGTATVTVNVTADEGEGHKSVEIEVVEVKTVSEAVTIAAALDSGATTSYRVKLTGFVSSLDADGKARAVNVTDGSKVIEIFFGGGNADYTTVKDAAFIGSKLSVYAKIQNYSGTYETTNNILIGVDDGDADSYAAGAYKSLDESCATGVSAVTADQWSALAAGFNALEPSEQEKFREEDVSVYGENVVNWVNRYEIIVSNSSLSNFMALTSVQSMYDPMTENNGSTIIIIIAATFAITTFGAVLLIRKKKHSK